MKSGQHDAMIESLVPSFRHTYNAIKKSNDETIDKIDILRNFLVQFDEESRFGEEARPVLEATLAHMLSRTFMNDNSTSNESSSSSSEANRELNAHYFEVPHLEVGECEKILEYYSLKGFIYPRNSK